MKTTLFLFLFFASNLLHAQARTEQEVSGMHNNGKQEGSWKSNNEHSPVAYMKSYAASLEDATFKTTGIDSIICPNPKKLKGLCMSVSSKQMLDLPWGRFVWKYQQRLAEAACVDPTRDSEEEIGRKIAAVMKQYGDMLICNNPQFDVSNGNVIKYAIAMKFDEFIIDMSHYGWGVNLLNKVDELDGRTVLDYIQKEMARNKGLSSEPILQRYYNMVRKAGGKHKSEL